MNAAKKKSTKLHPRSKCYQLLGIARKQLEKTRPGFSDDDYRHILFMNGATMVDGKFSATTMTVAQLQAALSHCQDLGFRISKKVQRERATKSGEGNWRAPRVGKLNALWISLADAGVIHDRSESAMRHYCENKVPGLTKFEWITSAQLNTAIEMLKAMHRQRGIKLTTTGNSTRV